MARKPKPRKKRVVIQARIWYHAYYNSAWWSGSANRDGISKALLREHPWCNVCKVEPGAEVDHIVPHRGNWELFRDEDNLQVICTTCHSRKTQRGE